MVFGGIGMSLRFSICLAMTLTLLLNATVSGAQSVNRVTILVDAFGRPSALRLDWGFSAFVEYGGKRILFDAGNNTDIFAHNIRALGVDLTRLDFVVISHRHGDHTDGLRHLLRVNPRVRIYAPNDEHFGGPTPAHFYRRAAPSLPSHMRYFGGVPPEVVPHGSVWNEANLVRVSSVTEIAPGIRLIPAGSHERGNGIPELSLSIRTSRGQVMFVGCSHPGIENILEAASAESQRVRIIFGGLHWVTMPEAEIERSAVALRDRWRVEEVAPGHCTGEPAFAVLQRAFGDRYRYAGVGTVIELPH
jgi:7,8-dihydropterin-6-yl-methyl-4-(beta-D-ribofuranosyl)aminobenzene 5'-phosphate synthase